ncbi:hypothetical protein [Polaribacter ponticola]|uniref:Integrase catalytic domain-containing protein n=1 Tax=Polaribacter ponticola TaxID=2978475 RepID=A0ABT5SF20_9FLAO|nr:hypothetical protein [Polaribacter sp. MSW5]MDD7915842.1 hypothetical protein [Polaribacter sp. MSW5]
MAIKHQTSEDIESALLNYTEYYENNRNYRKSLTYHKKYLTFKDSLAKKLNIKVLQELETKYQTEKKKKK